MKHAKGSRHHGCDNYDTAGVCKGEWIPPPSLKQPCSVCGRPTGGCCSLARTLSLHERAHNVEITTQAIAQLARDFAREALREYVLASGSNRRHWSHEERFDAAIAAAERGARCP